MLNVTLDVLLNIDFVKKIEILPFLQYKDYKNILLFDLCFDMTFL